MDSISSARLSAPGLYAGEIMRQKLIEATQNSLKEFVYIHAGAGYGKTTLLSQFAELSGNAVWLTLAGERDVFSFLGALCDSIRRSFKDFDFAVSEYLPFADQENFMTILANALIASIEKLDVPFTLICDDLHTVENSQIKELIADFLRYAPKTVRVLMGSREALWQEFIPLYLKGEIFELTQNDLTFTQDEMFQVLGLEDEEIYRITEGWPLAVGSFRVLLENGVTPSDVSARGKDALYSYLFYECIRQMSSETVNFVKASASFEELDPPMLDEVLNKKNTRLILESLVSRNMFTMKTTDGQYRYHALFRDGLLQGDNPSQQRTLQRKAALYYLNRNDFSKATEYATEIGDNGLLQKIILRSHNEMTKAGRFSELRTWFQALGDPDDPDPEILVAKGVFLSATGNFVKAKECLDAAIPRLEPEDRELYMEAMTSKARVLRNYVSFEESDALLDSLIAELGGFASETAYAVVIEKIYNLCWESQINGAMSLCLDAIEGCARAGNLKIKAWFERYLSAVYFFAGNMRQSVYYYEKSLSLPEEERRYLDMHSIGIFAAKAYQMLGDRDRAVSVITDELQKLRTTGKYEEIWYGYLFAAEIHYQNAYIDRMNGKEASYETTIRYFTLADEYAPLFRKTDYQLRWAKMLRLSYSLFFAAGPKDEIEAEILANLDTVGAYFQSITLGRLFGYYTAESDYSKAVKYAKEAIAIGEKTGMYLHLTVAYGILARIAISKGSIEEAELYTGRLFELCHKNGIYEYFKVRKDYDPVLEFASKNGVEPDITKELLEFSGYTAKKAYIKILGGFSVFPYDDRVHPLRIQRKKERELLAFLLDVGEAGATKDQICDAIWPESKSKDVNRMANVYLAQIKKDLCSLGIKDSIVFSGNMYTIRRDEIECDFELFENAVERFQNSGGGKDKEEILNLYTGEYLADFEAFWATKKRIKYSSIYEGIQNAVH